MYVEHPRRVLFNTVYGGIGLSDDFCDHATKTLGYVVDSFSLNYTLKGAKLRMNEEFIEAILAYGLEKASRRGCSLAIATIPPYHSWTLHDMDGSESVELMFPWKELALAQWRGESSNTLLVALAAGKLKLCGPTAPGVVVADAYDFDEYRE